MTRREPIESERLSLVPLTPAAADDLLAGGDGEVVALAGWPHADTLDGIRAGQVSGDPDALPWLVVLRSPDETGVIGDLGWRGTPGPTGEVEIGYGIAAPYRRRGYGTEAAGALVGWLDRQPDVRRIVAEALADNLASRRLLERLGFTIERVDGAYVWYARAGASGS